MRIRTIKPEFWASESIGRLSRDARLLFIGFWSLSDDSGRGRGALQTISGSLFPYDSDAQKHLPKWISELEREGMVRLYKCQDGNTYFDIPNWLKHQKIEKPSAPKFPPFTEQSGSSRGGVGEGSPLDQGSGKGRDQVSGKTDEDAFCVDVLNHLNATASREFRATESNLTLIRCRLEEVKGDVAGVKAMVSRQTAKWKTDPKMSEFLRPETLFCKSKFGAYYDNRNLPVDGSTKPAPPTGETEEQRKARIKQELHQMTIDAMR